MGVQAAGKNRKKREKNLMDLFKTVIMVVAVGTVLFLLGNLLGLFSFEPGEVEAIRKQLKNAEARPGKFLGGEIMFSAGTGLSTKTFESGRRIMGFGCNTARLCCPEAQACKGAIIEWDSKRLFAKEQGKILVSTRCEPVGGLFSCKSYFGETPAQLGIEDIAFKEQYDVRKEKPKLGIVFKNTGTQPVFSAEISVEVFSRFVEEGVERKVKLEEKTASVALGRLEPLQTHNTGMELYIAGTGRFEAIVTVSGKDAGYDSKIIVFSTFKSKGNCRTDRERAKEIFWIEGNTCGEKHYCQGCEFGFECAEAWEEEGARGLEVGNTGFAYKKIKCE